MTGASHFMVSTRLFSLSGIMDVYCRKEGRIILQPHEKIVD